ncbi:MFS transporter [Myxococcota bacterium]|nr:MFS transporter [Myxococcota bacterium]MBU1432542.1 MFS transporter [Myxococcota bacterium]MBU1898831.1 MFS transporter [Myxococcota bacterium]
MASATATINQWRWRVFAATWASYAGFYFCRKPFFIVKSALNEELGWSPTLLGAIGTLYLLSYAIGQFIAGWGGTRFGPRRLLLLGMGVSILSGVAFGLTNSWMTFGAFMVLNGLAQATGWSGNVASIAPWFRRQERGTVMGFWTTNYQVGGVAANALAAWILGIYGFRYAFFSGSVVLLAVWAFFFFNQRDKPEDLGFASLEEQEKPPELSLVKAPRQESALKWDQGVLTNVLLVGVFYFFVKFVRYAIWSWTPFLLHRDFDMTMADAGYLSTAFDLAGIAGAISIGYLSDKLFKGRRVRISFIFIVLMAASTGVLYLFGGQSLILFGVSIGLVGFTLYGPDALMTGAGAIEVGSLRGAAMAAGIINGMGSFGGVLQELLLGRVLEGRGAGAVFTMLLIAAVLAALALSALLLRMRGQEEL